MKIAVSYINSKYKEKITIQKIDSSIADYIHVDLMDGKFVEVKNFTIGSLLPLFSGIKKPLDVHLMTLKPDKYYEDLATLNTEYITIHIEAIKDVMDDIQKVKTLGIKVGIAINPETDLKTIMPYLKEIDKVIIMSVHPGYGGQEFLVNILPKIDDLISIKKEQEASFEIEIDGGINDITKDYLMDKPIDVLVSGSFICQSDNFDSQIKKLK